MLNNVVGDAFSLFPIGIWALAMMTTKGKSKRAAAGSVGGGDASLDNGDVDYVSDSLADSQSSAYMTWWAASL